MKQIYITTAILAAIKSFGNTGFSIYDITSKIRKEVEDELYTLTILGTEVRHYIVKEWVEELLAEDLLNNYAITYHNDGYRILTKLGDDDPVALPAYIPYTPDTPVDPPTTTDDYSGPITAKVQSLIFEYLQTHSPVYVKQVQSRLKGYPYTCKQIKEFLASQNRVCGAYPNESDSQTVVF